MHKFNNNYSSKTPPKTIGKCSWNQGNFSHKLLPSSQIYHNQLQILDDNLVKFEKMHHITLLCISR